MIKILQIGESVLRKTAEEVPIEDIKTPRIQKIIEDMKNALASQDDGVAIAAPQIGVSLRIFVVSGKVLTKEGEAQKPDEVFINPRIVKRSRKKEAMEEGCLSVRGQFGTIMRSDRATVEGYNENGEKVSKGGSGLLAQIFQHETDHLDGVLFVDNAIELVEQNNE